MRLVSLMLALALFLSAGCSSVRDAGVGHEPPVKAVAPRPVGDAISLLTYFEYVRKLPPAELAKEHDAVRQQYASLNSNFVRVRYAILLGISGAAFNDDARALELLEPLLKNPDGNLYTLAYLLSAQIQEQKRGQGLQQKLEALKTLEKDLLEREPGAARRR
jgi:hypothetical protein